MKQFKFLSLIVAIGIIAFSIPGIAQADLLDKIISKGKLRCGVMLDVPPVGMRDAQNNPIGYDVEFAKDMAEALGVELVIVETPAPDRIPAILSGRVDIGVASATNSLERAKSVGFSIPYQIWNVGVAVVSSNEDIKAYEDLIGKKIGTVRGTTSEAEFLKDFKAWKKKGTTHISYGSNAEQFLALQQGKVDCIIESTAIFGEFIKGAGKGKIKIACSVDSFPADWTGLMVKRNEQGFLNWVNLFVWHQWKNGKTDELYKKWFGFPAPIMDYPGVHGY
jgi:hydroxyproline transporter system substrate-binding protein